MSTVGSVTSGYTRAANAEAAATTTMSAAPQKTLGQDDFLRLLAQQFQSQDPLKPMSDISFISQMAQFTSLQQSSTMTKEITAMRADQQRVTANSYLGHRVTVDAGEGKLDTGDVTAIDNTGSEPQLVVNDVAYPLSAVVRVEPSVVATSSSTTPTGQ